MNLKSDFFRMIVLAVLLTCGLSPAMAQEGRKFKVLVVMSYHEDLRWVQEIRTGIDSVLSGTCEIKYFYLDTYRNIEGGTQKAKDAYALYQEFQPDGVIAADDDAQSLFVVPYLKDKVKTPVMFCGVNAEPEQYGYPASNVSGVLERIHFKESVAFLQTMVPSVRTVAYIMGDTPTSQGWYQQIRKEMETYSAKSVGFRFVKTIEDAVAAAEALKADCDALFIDSIPGLKDRSGKTPEEKEIISDVTKAFGKPAIAANDYIIKFGILCAVVKTGQEQGEISSDMLLKAMNGTPVSKIPITRNHNGKRMINVTVLKELGIKPAADILGSAELVRTEN